MNFEYFKLFQEHLAFKHQFPLLLHPFFSLLVFVCLFMYLFSASGTLLGVLQLLLHLLLDLLRFLQILKRSCQIIVSLPLALRFQVFDICDQSKKKRRKRRRGKKGKEILKDILGELEEFEFFVFFGRYQALFHNNPLLRQFADLCRSARLLLTYYNLI